MRLPTPITSKLALAALVAGLSLGCRVEDPHGKAERATVTRERAAPPGTSLNHRESGDRDTLPAGYRERERGIGQSGDGAAKPDKSEALIRRDPAAARFARAVPDFTLADPNGARHDKASLLGPHGVVFIVTAPTLDQGDVQKNWNDQLQAACPDGARWILVEDMSQSMFAGRALDSMKEEFDPAKNPLILIDEEGQLRKQLGVGEGETVVLAYDQEGVLVHADESGEPDAARAQAAWATLDCGDGKKTEDAATGE